MYDKLEHEEPTREKESRMAKERKRRTYGAGCVIKEGKGLAIRWREAVICPEGKIERRLRYESLGDVSLRQANEELRKRIAGAGEPKQKPVTFREHAASWKTNVLPQYPKHSTRKHHSEILDNKLTPFFGAMLLEKITGEHVQQFIRMMADKGYAPHSIHHYHTVLSTVLSKAVKWKRISSNPAFGAELPRLKPVREQFVLDYRQAQDLLELLPGRARLAVLLALATGARRGELFALRWKHFDSSAGELSIEEAIYDSIIDSPKTENSVRTIPLPPIVVRWLSQWHQQTKYGKPADFILAGRKGIPGDDARILRDYIKPACEDLGIPAATWLTFRRTWATWADGKGITAKMRGEVMGNSAEINQQVYTKVLPETLRRAVEVVGQDLIGDGSNCSEIVQFCRKP
jgi:integrase